MLNNADVKVSITAACIMRQLSSGPTNEEPSFPPIVLASRGSEEDDEMLMISPRVLFNDQEKHGVIATCFAMARAWGADSLMFIADSLMIETEDPTAIDRPLSENPAAVDCIIATLFRADRPDYGLMAKYHYGPDGLRFDHPNELPEVPPWSPEGMDQGAVPDFAHRALSMTDEQALKMLNDAPIPFDTVDEAFEFLRSKGYEVTEAKGMKP
jgi:hypothetical protein